MEGIGKEGEGRRDKTKCLNVNVLEGKIWEYSRLGEGVRVKRKVRKKFGNGLYKVSGGKCRRECQLYQGFWKGEVTLKYVEK